MPGQRLLLLLLVTRRHRLLPAEPDPAPHRVAPPARDLRNHPRRARPADGVRRSGPEPGARADQGGRRDPHQERDAGAGTAAGADGNARRLHQGKGAAQFRAAQRRRRRRHAGGDADPVRALRHQHGRLAAGPLGQPAHQAPHGGRGDRGQDRPQAAVPADLLHLPDPADGAARPGRNPDRPHHAGDDRRHT